MISIMLLLMASVNTAFTAPLDAVIDRNATTATTNTTILVPAAASTTAYPIPSKTNVPDCNYRGLPSTALDPYYLPGQYEPNVFDCQTLCETTDSCESYSFRETNNIWYPNCQLYSIEFDPSLVIFTSPQFLPGIWFSNRWPSDGSGHCYG